MREKIYCIYNIRDFLKLCAICYYIDLHKISLLQMHKIAHKLVQRIMTFESVPICVSFLIFIQIFIIYNFIFYWMMDSFNVPFYHFNAVFNKCSRNIDCHLIAFIKNNLVFKYFSLSVKYIYLKQIRDILQSEFDFYLGL